MVMDCDDDVVCVLVLVVVVVVVLIPCYIQLIWLEAAY
jgi:hypothetical protein